MKRPISSSLRSSANSADTSPLFLPGKGDLGNFSKGTNSFEEVAHKEGVSLGFCHKGLFGLPLGRVLSFLLASFIFVGFAYAQEINVTGSGNTIPGDGSNTPQVTDDTDFGAAAVSGGTVVRTFTIANLVGPATLAITAVNVLPNDDEFSVTASPSSPIAVSSSTTFDITFNPTGTGTRTAQISINNNDSNENPYVFNIEGEGTNAAPVITNLDATSANTFIEDPGTAIQLDADVTVSDTELDALNGGSGDYTGATITISRNGGANSDDSFSFGVSGSYPFSDPDISRAAPAGVIASFDDDTPGTVIITFTGNTPTTADAYSVLRLVRYSNSSDTPPDDVDLDVVLNDGAGGVDTKTITVNITAVNDAPEIADLNLVSPNSPFLEGQDPIIIDPDVTISDPELDALGNYSGAEITIERGPANSVDVFSLASDATYSVTGTVLQRGVTTIGSFTNSSGTVTIAFTSNTPTKTDVERVLELVEYSNSSISPVTNLTLNVVLNDGGTPEEEAPEAINIGITAANDESNIIVDAGLSKQSNFDPTDYTATDIDLGTAGDELEVARFTLQDGGDDNTDSDGAATVLSEITFVVSNPDNINKIALYSGGSELAEGTLTAGVVEFTGLSLTAADEGTATLNVYVTFVTDGSVVDGEAVDVTIDVSELAYLSGSGFASGFTSGANLTDTNSSDENRIDVTTDRLAFTSIPGSAVELDATFSVTVSATDINNNLDVDDGSTVTLAINSGGSTPTLGGTTSGALSGGVRTYSNLTLDEAADFTLSADDGGALIDAVSGTITIESPDTDSDIVEASFTYPEDIDYTSYITSDISSNQANSIQIGEFTIRDGGTGTDSDVQSTTLTDLTIAVGNFANIDRVALFDNSGTYITEVSPDGSGDAIFSGLSISATDDGTENFRVHVSFQTTVTEDDAISLSITEADVTASASGSGFTSSSFTASTTLTSPDNEISVTADRLAFTSIPGSPVALNATFSVTVSATDGNGSVDLDDGSTVTLGIQSGGTSPTLGGTTSGALTSGVRTYSNLTLDEVAGFTLSADDGGALTDAVSGTITVESPDSDSDIVEASFTYPEDIAYTSYITSDISSNQANSIQIGEFTIRDGGAGTDGDAQSTTLTDLTIAVGNFANIDRVALFDNSGTYIAEVSPGGGDAIFSGLSISAADDGTENFRVHVSFQTTVTEDDVISLTITEADVTANALGSGFTSSSFTASTTLTSPDNEISVTADRLAFTSIPGSAVAVNATFSVTVSATDVNNNLDVDDGSTVTLGIQSGGSSPTLGGTTSGALSGGVRTYSNLTLDEADDFTLSADDGGALIDAVSGTITIESPDTDSDIVEASFTYPEDIDYTSYITSDISSNQANSIQIGEFTIRDGGTGTDSDVQSTTLTDLTIAVGNFANIDRVALFDNSGTYITEVSPDGSGDAIFSGLSISATDDGTENFRVHVSFQTTVTEDDAISLSITEADVTASALGSGFTSSSFTASTTLTSPDNEISVTADRLAFTSIPGSPVALNATFSVTVSATDVNNNLDVDDGSTVTLGIQSGGSSPTLGGTTSGALSGGVRTYGNLTLDEAADFTLSADDGGALIDAVSGTITIESPDTDSDIVEASFTYPEDIAYTSYITSDISSNQANSIQIGEFTIRDGGAGTDGDAQSTTLTDLTIAVSNFANIDRVALFDNSGTYIAEVSPGGGDAIFSGLSISAADDGTENFRVHVSFQTTVTEDDAISLTITEADVSANVLGSGFTSSSFTAATTLTSPDNEISVTADRLAFTSIPGSAVAVNATFSVTVSATDVNNNLDVDDGSTVTLGIQSGGSSPTLGGTTSGALSGGVRTYSNLTLDEAADFTLSADDGGALIDAVSGTITIESPDTDSDIVEASFTYPEDIDYTSYITSDISSNQANSIQIGEFTIRDGGTGTDSDVQSTTLTDLTIAVGNFANIDRVALFDNSGTYITEVSPDGSGDAIFSGLSISAADDGTENFRVHVSFQTTVTEDDAISLSITEADVTASALGSGFTSSSFTASTTLTSPDNEISVNATHLAFTTEPVEIGVETDFVLVAEAQDDNDNTDADFTEDLTIEVEDGPGGGNLSASAGSVTATTVNGQLVNGVATFNNLQVNKGGDYVFRGVSASYTNNSGNEAETGTIEALDDVSDIIENQAFISSYPEFIDYDQYDDDDLDGGGTDELVIARFDIRDGGEFGDDDDKVTRFHEIDLQFQGGSEAYIHRMAVYTVTDVNGLGSGFEVAEYDVEADGGDTFDFDFRKTSAGGPFSDDFDVPDNSSAIIEVRVSFVKDVDDQEVISLLLVDAEEGGGKSKFTGDLAIPFGGALDGVQAGTNNLTGGDNMIDVVATKLVLTNDASLLSSSPYERTTGGISPVIQAQDDNDNVDLDEESDIAVTGPTDFDGTGATTEIFDLDNGIASPLFTIFSEEEDVVLSFADNDGTAGSRTGTTAIGTGDASSAIDVYDQTAPTVTSRDPADDATGVPLTDELEIVFSEDVAAVAGGHVTVVSDHVPPDVFELDVDNVSEVSISGSTVTMTLPEPLRGSARDYYVLIDADAFDDSPNNTDAVDAGALNFAGYLTDNGWEFTTGADNDAPTLTITRNAVTNGSFDNTSDATVSFDLAFSEPMDDGTVGLDDVTINTTGVTVNGSAADLTADNAAYGGVITLTNDGDDQNYTLTIGSVGLEGSADGTISISVGPSIDDENGNAMGGAEGPSDAFTIDQSAPTLESMTISSGTAPTDHATTGELVTLTMDFNDDLSEAPTVDFTSGSAAINGTVTVLETDAVNDIWTASFTVSALDTDGDIDFTLDFTDDAGNAGATADNTDLDGGAASTVEVDNTAPTVLSASIDTDNGTDDQYATDLDVVTLTFTVDDDLLADPTVTFSSGGTAVQGSVTINNASAPTYTATYTVDGNGTIVGTDLDGEGAVTFTIDFDDDAGNSATTVTSVTDGTEVEVDYVAPTRETLEIISDNATDDQHGVDTDVVTITIDFDDDLSADPVPTILSGGVAINDGSPTVTETDAVNEVWEITYVVDGGDTEGAVTFSIAFTDDAGNAGTAITEAEITNGSSIEIDHTAPTLQSMTIVSGTAPTDHATTGEVVTLTMDFDDDLSEAPTVDFTSGSAAINGTVTVTETDAANDIWTASFTVSALDTDGDIDFTLDFTDDAGNAGTTADNTDLDGGAASTVEVDNTAPTVLSASIDTDNGTDDQHATDLDVVTLTFTVDDDLLADPTVTFSSGGTAVQGTVTIDNASAPTYTATYTVDGDGTTVGTDLDGEGVVTFTIDFDDDAGNSATTVTSVTDGTEVEVDYVAPTRETLEIISDNATDDQHGVATDVVTITIDFDDDLSADPVPTISSGGSGINDGSPTVTETDAVNEVWEITYVVDGGDSEGAVTFSIAFTDDAGNTGTAITEAEITNGSSIEIDHTAPTLESMTIASGVAPTDHATTGELVTLTMDFDDDLSEAPTVDFTSGSAAINGTVTVTETDAANDIWTASFTVSALDTDGDIDFTLDFTDDAGNAGTTADNTDLDGGAASTVEVDNTAPTVLSASIDTDNGTDDQHATDLDVVTLTFTVDDDLLADPTVTFSSGGTAVQGTVTIDNASAPTYTATYTVDGDGTTVGTDLDGEGAVTFTIDFDDDAGNSATTVTSVTDGTEVEVDYVAPTRETLEIISDNATDDQHGVATDVVTITIDFDDDLSADPVPTISSGGSGINDGSPTVTETDAVNEVWEITYVVDGGDSEGAVTFSIAFTDDAGNTGTAITEAEITNGSSIEIDHTAPTLESMTIASGVAPTDHATTGELVTLTMDFDDDLSEAPTVDFTSGSAAINGTVTVLETDAANDIWTASFTVSALDTDGDIDFTLDFTDDAGNAGATADNTDLDGGAASTVEVDNTAPTVLSASIDTDNGTDDQYATDLDVVTLTFTVDDDLLADPTVTFSSGGTAVQGSVTINNASAPTYTATYTVDGNGTIVGTDLDGEGAVTFTIDFDDDAGNSATTVMSVTDGTEVEVDYVAPTRETLEIISDNATDDQHGVDTDVVTITIDFDDDLSADPVPTILSGGVAINDGSPTVTETDAVNEVWEITYVVDGGDTEGAVTFSIAFTDDAGNAGTAITEAEITNGSSIEIDHTAPTLQSMTIASGVAPTDHAMTGEVVTLTMDFDDDLSEAPTVDFTSGSAAINGTVTVTETDAANDIWTASFTVSALDTDGDIDFTLDFTDDAGNAGATADNTDLDGGAASTVEVDNTAPTVLSASIDTDNGTDDQHATDLDVVTLTFTVDDDLLADPTVTFSSGGTAVQGSVTINNASAPTYTATYTVDGDGTIVGTDLDGEGAVTFTIDFDDDAGNSATTVTSVTDGTEVEVDFTPATLQSAVQDSDTQITVTFNEVVGTNGTNPTDFTVTDANTPSVNYVVSAQADGTADDAEIVLTVADLSGVIGDLLVSYTDNSGEIYDLAGVSAATSGPVTIDRVMTGIVSLSEDATDVASGDTNGDDLAMYRTSAGNDPGPLTPVTITPSISGSTITIYEDEGLTSAVQTYNNVTTNVSPTVADLVGIDFGDGTADHGVYTFYITETAVNGSSSEGPEVEYSIAFLDDISLSPSELVFSGENSSGTELSLDDHPATGQNLTFSGDGLTDFDINPGSTSSARFVPIAAGVGTTSIDVIWENDATGVEAGFTSVVNFTVNATTEVFVGQATNLGKSEGNQFLNVNSSPDAIDVGEDLSDGSDPDFYSLEVYYIENGAVKTDIPGDAPGALRPDGNLTNLLLAYDSDNNRPPITAGVPTFTEDEWEFDPSAFTALGVSGAQEVDTLLFIYVVSSDDGATLVENAFANIRLYPNPDVEIQGVDDYYCNSDDEFPILIDLFTYDGDGGVDLNDVAISNGYKLLYKQASADPYVQIADSTATGSAIVNTFDPSQVAAITGGNDIGFYRIEYTTDPQTAASTTSTTTFDFQVLGHAAEPIIVSNLDSIGGFDAIGYLLEYSVGQDLGTLTSSGASVTWLDQIDQEISSGNTIDVRDDVFGIDPTIRTSRTIQFFDNNLIDNAGVPTVDFDGCPSDNVLVDIEIYPIPDAPVVLIADNVNEEDVSTATQNSFLFEYCEDDVIADMTFDNDVSDSRAHFTVYDANLNRVLDSAFVTLNWSQHIFGNETPRDTIIFIATVTEDSIFAGGGNTAFPGSTSDTSKIELRVHEVPVSILDMVTSQGKDLFFTEYFTCEGDDFAPIDAPEVLDPAGVKNDTLFFWYLDDGDLTFAGTPFVFGAGGDEFLQESPSLTTGDLEGFTTTYQDPSGGAMTTAEFDINVPGTYYVWVTEAVQQSEDSDFPGCQSEPTLVSITVFPDALEATIDGKMVSPNNSNDVDYEYFFCASDLDVSVTFEAALNGFADAAFSTNASIVAADTMAANVISEFNWYNSNAEGAQQTQRFTGATATAVDLGLITSVDDTVYIYLEQVTNIVTDANGDRIYSGCEAPGVVIQFTIFREPDAPVVDEPIYYYCEGDVIDDLSVATEANAFVTWSVEGSAATFSNQASYEGDGTGIAVATMADLGIGQNPPADSTYTINVVQRMDETAGSAIPPESEAFVGCTSEATQIRVLVRANPDPVTITTSLACSDGQLVDIQFSGDQLANSFYIYPTDVQERSLRRDTLGGNAEQFSFELLGYEEGMDTIIYMSQIVATDLDPDFDGCESELTPIPIYAAPRLGDFGGGNGLINDPRACNDVRLLEVQVTNLGEDVFEDFDFQWTVSSELRTEETEISTSSPISGGAQTYSITMEETIQDLTLPVIVVVEDTKNGCQSTAVRNVGIGNTPDPQFSLFNITENNNTSYVFDDFEITDNNEIERLTFELRQGSATLNIFERIQEPGVDILDTLETSGLNAGAYSGVLTLRSVNGCEASKERPFDILQSLKISAENSRVFDFNLVDADGWRVETQNGFADRNQGWEVAEPAGENIDDDPDGRGTPVWVTNADGNYSENSDQSFVYSPSYDFSEVVRPAVTFDYFKNLVNASDGVVFQWSGDDGRSWQPLGSFDDQNGTSGLLWFDRAGISGNPGVFEENPNQVGWADTDSLQWKEAVHSLGVIPQGDRENIRFRFALGVRPGSESDKSEGFAFDNFRIFGRDRITILETFSSTLDESSLTSNEEVYSSIDGNEEIIWVNYFTDLANDLNARDEINAINRADPEARLAFYGISKVPTAALSGEVQVQEPDETSIGDLGFNENDLGRTSLVVPLFDVELTANVVSADLVEITATATAKPDNGTDLDSETSVRVMILQNEVSSEFVENVSQEYTFRNRLVEILPSSVGEVIVGEIEDGQEIFNQTLEWEVRNLLGAANTEIDLTVLVFVQDEISKGVYQAASAQVTVTLPETVTGILPGVISADTYSVYPNPGDRQFTIRMDQVMTEDTNWSIADYSGKEVLSGQMKRGINETVVNIENLANGVYLLRLHNNANTWELKKLMVLRR